MIGSSQTLYVAVPASAAAHDGSPRRDLLGPRGLGLAAVLATCAFVAFLGWALSRGDSALAARGAATGAAASACYSSNCGAPLARVAAPLPREWRWERKAIEFEHMYRE